MQPNEGFGETAIRTFLKVFAGVMALVFSSFVGLFLLGFLAAAFGGDTPSANSVDQIEYETISGVEDAPVKLVSIPIEGVILGEPSSGDVLQYLSSLNVTYGYKVKQQLINLTNDDSVDGVILEVHSPGGTIFGTQAIVDGVEYFREKTGKPVYAYVGSMAASGGYWTAISADKVIADHGVTVGSIGVLSGPFKYYKSVVSEDGGAFLGGVVTEDGIQTSYITAGANKDFGNPYREMTEDELNIMQQSVTNAYQDFVSYVTQRRNISADVIVNQLGAMVYDERQGLNAGLIDEIGSKELAYTELTDAIQPGADYTIVRSAIPMGLFESLFFSARSLVQQPTATTESICGLSSSVLAYHGDPGVLCQ